MNDGERPTLPHLMGPGEVAECLGVSRQFASTLRVQDPKFPAPVLRLYCGEIWLASDIEVYAAARNRKPGRPRKTEEAGE